MDRRDLQALAKIRLREAKALLSLGLNDGAYYLAGYAVECALKACIAKQTRRHEFPDKVRVVASHTHDLRTLVKLAKLEDARLERVRTDNQFRYNWGIVEQWSEQSRYRRSEEASAQALLRAANGIVGWIRLHW